MEVENDGDVVTKNTYVVSQIPNNIEFTEAYLTGTDENGIEYNCENCKILFADNNSSLPTNLSLTEPFEVSDFVNFTN